MISEALLTMTIAHLKTTDAEYAFLYELDSVHDYLFKSGSLTTNQILEQHMSQEHGEFIKSSIANMSNEQVAIFFKELAEALKSAPRFEITLAFKYDAGFASTLYDWVSHNLGGHYLLDILYDPEIIGGGVFVYDGLYKDYSLRKELSKFFESKDGLQKLI